MRDYDELVKELREKAERYDYNGWVETAIYIEKIADAIEELVAVCREIAAFVIHYADDDEVSAEVLCRKLHKIGLIEKDGAWWTLPDPPKEDAHEG